MKTNLRFFFFTIFLIAIPGVIQGQTNAPKMIPSGKNAERIIKVERLQEEVEFLCDTLFNGRATGSKGANEAAFWIARRFKKAGLMRMGGKWSRSFEVSPAAGHNIIGFMPGMRSGLKEQYVIVTAHYDSHGSIAGNVYPGADSNASGVVALLSIADMFARMKELDFSVITNIDNIDPQFRTSQVDPEGKYTVPYMGTASLWLGNPQKLEELGVKADNYEDLKDPRFEGNILMSDDAQGNICCGLSAMDLDPTSNDLADIEQAKQYLLSINKNVKAYSLPADVRDSMIKNEATVAYMYSGNIMQAMQANPNLQLALGEEKVSLSIDNLVILKGTKHKTEAELFINYLLRGDVSAKLTTEFPYVCFNTAAVEYLPEELAKSELCLLSDDIKSRIYMLNTFNGEAIAAEIDAMVEVKTSR